MRNFYRHYRQIQITDEPMIAITGRGRSMERFYRIQKY